jgi:RNA polymerase sigma-70 factor (ECF subfamily)
MDGGGVAEITDQASTSLHREQQAIRLVDLAPDVDDDRLIARVQVGDREAVALLYRRYFNDVSRYVRSIVRDSARTHDVCQEVFVTVMRKAHRYEPHAETPLLGWIFTIARNLSIDAIRARNRDPSVPWDPDELTEFGCVREESSNESRFPDLVRRLAAVEHDIPALRWVSDKDLAVLIRRLPDLQRAALTLRYQHGLDTTEIAEVLGCTPRAVNDLDFRAKRFLAERLKRLGRDALSFRREWLRLRMRRDPVLAARRYALTASPGASSLFGPGGAMNRRRW